MVNSTKKIKNKSSARANVITLCSHCSSTLKPLQGGGFECTGDKLANWEAEFIAFYKLSQVDKTHYLTNISNYSKFIELYDRWAYSQVNPGEAFSCGYSNFIYPITTYFTIKIPDPIFVKRLEKKLGRALTEEELIGEAELWFYSGRILTAYKKRAKQVKIPYIVLPSEETVYS